MLGADSHFWLANNHEVYTRVSHLTSSAWDIRENNIIDDVTMVITTAFVFSCRCDATK